MTCYYPREGWRARHLNPSGKRGLVFNRAQGYVDMPVTVPCGRCLGCRLEKSRQWAIRLLHESKLHEDKCFVTLTYNREHLPYGGTLVKEHFQEFINRLRMRHRRASGRGIRYFHCGEYGEDVDERPHYHACLFGIDFPDKMFFKRTETGHVIYTSKSLEDAWGKGFVTVGSFSFESAAYCARYIMKKVTGPEAPGYYMKLVPETGELVERVPEYVTMSLRPGIGSEWAKLYITDFYPCDFAVMKGKKLRVPRYYDSILGLMNGPMLTRVKAIRSVRGKTPKAKYENSPERLRVREEVKASQISNLKRDKAK